MRVTLLSKALVVGAYQRKCELIAAHPEVELTVLVPPAWGAQRLERAYARGYDLREIPIRANGNFHLHYYPTLAAELARSRPDVLHIDEEPYNLATWRAMQALGSLGTARALFFTWQNIKRDYPPPFSWIERDVLRRADAAIAGSDEAARVWRAKGFVKPIVVIPQFGVDEEAFAPAARAHWAGPFTVGFAGRLEHAKGVDLLIEAAAHVPAARVLIAGQGEQERELRALAARLGMAERIEFAGAIASTHMPAFYHRLDAFVLPSRTLPNWKEQFGRVLIEAMACGVPVVGARSGEIPNLIGDAGLTFAEGDVAGLRACLAQLAAQPALRTDLAARGRARVLERYTMRRVADRTIAVYRSLAGA